MRKSARTSVGRVRRLLRFAPPEEGACVPFPSSLPRPRLVALLALAGALLALVAAGCGGGGGDENADPASITPKNAPLYFTAFVRPEGDQKDAVDSIAKKVAGV